MGAVMERFLELEASRVLRHARQRSWLIDLPGQPIKATCVARTSLNDAISRHLGVLSSNCE